MRGGIPWPGPVPGSVTTRWPAPKAAAGPERLLGAGGVVGGVVAEPRGGVVATRELAGETTAGAGPESGRVTGGIGPEWRGEGVGVGTGVVVRGGAGVGVAVGTACSPAGG